jgi:hypothetical protein
LLVALEEADGDWFYLLPSTSYTEKASLRNVVQLRAASLRASTFCL